MTEAFDKLNVHNRDFLTLREFINGFGVFLGVDQDLDSSHDSSEDALRHDSHHDSVMENAELEKAIELFNACDVNGRGNVSLDDLTKFTHALGLSEIQISDIFEKLDDDGNGFITLNEFVNGFSHFLHVNAENTDNNNFEDDVISDFNTATMKRREPTIDEIYFMDSTAQQQQQTPSGNSPLYQHHYHQSGITENNRDHLERSDSHSSRASERSFITRQMSIRYETGATEIDDMLEGLETEFGRYFSLL